MEKKLILRGVFAGALAGLLAFVFARIFGEPEINKAIAYQDKRDAFVKALDIKNHITPPPDGPDIFSRSIQANLGIGVGMIAFGAAMGALFAVAFAVCLGRVGMLKPRSLACLVALGGFLGIYLVPFIKYPSNPPSIGNPDTIKARGGLYLVMVLASVILLVAAVWLGQRLQARFGNWNATLLACAAFVVAIGALMLALPSVGELAADVAVYGHHATETPLDIRDAKGNVIFGGFPADVLFYFRFYSVAAQVILWTALALIFAPLGERVLAPLMGERQPSLND